MKLSEAIVDTSLRHHRLVTGLMVLATLVLGLLLPAVKVDTDPENMLSEDEAVRVFHNQMKQTFDLNDMVVLGVVNEKHPYGVFNPGSLARIHELTEFALAKLEFPVTKARERGVAELLADRYAWAARRLVGAEPDAPPRASPLVEQNVIAPSVVDNVEPGGPGEVRLDWLMKEPPATQEEALAVRDRIVRNPLLYGTMVSEDAKALCIYLPLKSKDLSHNVYAALRREIAGYAGDERYHITGLPVAEDTFGVEMFMQMAVSAPIAMAVVFLLMLYFFRKLVLVISPMIVAMVSVVMTMGLLIGTGNTVHIMSSMIPIFIMPIAVLDSIHILSEFFERYQATRDRAATMRQVMGELFQPMLYTSLTSTAGFLSLALTPIPPVQVFGIFVAAGVMIAWALTVTFIPAYAMFIREKSLENFGSLHRDREAPASRLSRFLAAVGGLTYRRAGTIVAVTAAAACLAGYGISRIRINDNPVKWFEPSHPIRVADRELKRHFAGTYMAYLVLAPEVAVPTPAELAGRLAEVLPREAATLREAGVGKAPEVFAGLATFGEKNAPAADSAPALVEAMTAYATGRKNDAADREDDDAYDAWNRAEDVLAEELLRFTEPVKDPHLLRYIERLQQAMLATGVVGKSTSVADVVKTVHRDMYEGDPSQLRVPDSRRAVGNVLMQFQGGHRPWDLFHMVTRDYRRANVWVQLRSGDNRDMQRVVDGVDAFVRANPPPVPLRYARGLKVWPEGSSPPDRPPATAAASPAEQQAGWFGLTYINVEWQSRMVSGMLLSFLGSFLVVFLMMIVLFRSALWGLLSMIPLTVTIGLIYGLVGLLGIDYDMPIAVLSSLTLGLAVDFAIHFLSRSRAMAAARGTWAKTAGPVFGEPARAIARNIIVIAVGFLPLLFAPLVPYKTVGIFLATILATSGVGTLLILPALVRLLERFLFAERKHPLACYCGTCFVAALAAVAVVAVNVHQYLNVGITRLTWLSIALVPVLLIVCRVLSRREACAAPARGKEDGHD